MSNSVGVGENITLTPEITNNRIRLLYRPEAARKNLGKYFIDERVNGIIKGKKIVSTFLDGQEVKVPQQSEPKNKKERKRNFLGKKTLEKRPSVVGSLGKEDVREIQFVGLVRDYHNQLSSNLEQNNELLKDHVNEFLDPLSIGILYEIHKDNLAAIKPSDFPALTESDQFKIAKKNTLLALAEESLSRMDGPDLKEVDKFQKYLEKKNDPGKNLSDHELKNLFIEKLEDNSEAFLQDYYINFRFSEDTEALSNSRNVFKLGEYVTREVIKVKKSPVAKLVNVEDFLPYEDKERHIFFEKRFWGSKMDAELESKSVKVELTEALHKKEETTHRTNKALLDRGVLSKDSDGNLYFGSEFIEIFADYFEKDKPVTQNQMIIGILYSMRAELGVGVLPQAEVLKRAQKIIPGLQRVGSDLLTNFIGNNISEFFPELSQQILDSAKDGLLSKNILKDLNEVVRKDENGDYSQELFSVISRNRQEFFKLLVNNRNIDGFAVGEMLGDILKRTASEKKAEDAKNLSKLEEQTGDENAVMSLLIEGKEIADPMIRDRVETSLKKSSQLLRYVDQKATQAKVAIQNKIFYSEGESPFMAPPSLTTEAESAAVGIAGAAAYGHFVNHFLEDPVNRGAEAAIFVGGYFIVKEGGAYIKEIRTRKKELGIVRPRRKGRAYIPFTKDQKEFLSELKTYRKDMKVIKRETSKKFWHNKGKMLYSSGSYLLTSIGVNYLLQSVGLSGTEAPMVLAATNVAVSGLLSAGGMRSGAEFIVNSLGSKKSVDGGMELLTGKKNEKKSPGKKPEFHFRFKIIDRPFQYIKNKAGIAFATNIAPNIIRISRKIKYVDEVMTRHAEENRHLQVLERFVERKKNPNAKFSKEELIEAVEFLTLMKEEEGMLLIHNSRFYEKRMIRQPDGSFIEIDNRKGLGKIDETRREIVEYAQNNLPYEEYAGKNFDKPDDERSDSDLGVVEVALDFFSDIKTIRQKVFHKRMKYLIASYGYRVTFMVMSHALQSQGGLLEKPLNTIFGDSKTDPQTVINAVPTQVFHQDLSTPQGIDQAAKEVWARTFEFNNVVNLLNTTEKLSAYQPGIDNQLEYYGLNQAQVESVVNQLKAHNMNTSDLMRVVYVLSSYKEGQEYLAKIPGFEGTERRDLGPLIAYLGRKDPYIFMEEAINDKRLGLKEIIAIQYSDIDQRLGGQQITPGGNLSVEHVGNITTTFVDNLPKEQKEWSEAFLYQFGGILKSKNSDIRLAINNHYSEFLADSNNLADAKLNESDINDLPMNSMIYKIFHTISPSGTDNSEVVDLINKAKEGDVNSYNKLYAILEPRMQIAYSGRGVHGINRQGYSLEGTIFNNQMNTELYDNILINLPEDEKQAHDEIIRRIQGKMIGSLGLRPSSGPAIGVDEMANFAKSPDIIIDPHDSLGLALTNQVDLATAVSLQGNAPQIFIQNGEVVGVWRSVYQVHSDYTGEDLGILNSIEGSESQNDRTVLLKLPWRYLQYLRGNSPKSGVSTPAVSLVEMMSGGPNQIAINPEAPSNLHNYDKYGVDYLTKLIIADFRGRVPDDMMSQISPNVELNEQNPRIRGIVDSLCYKFESYLAARLLVANYGEDAVHKAFLDNASFGTVSGVEVKGVEAASHVLFNRSFKELSVGEKFMIEALAQSPNENLYDIQYDANGQVTGMVPNPTKAILHAKYLLEETKVSSHVDTFLPGQKQNILSDLNRMEEQANTEGWKSVFKGELKIPESGQNFAATQDSSVMQGFNLEQLRAAGQVKSISTTPQGTVVVLNDLTFTQASRIVPGQVLTSDILSGQHAQDAQLAVHYAALTTDATLDGEFYRTKSGTSIPAWYSGDFAVPGMAIVEVGPDGVVSIADPTNTLSVGPQLFGSSAKSLFVYGVLKIHPELNLGEQQFNAVSKEYQGQLIANSAHLVDIQGTVDLRHALSASANVPMVDMWTKLRAQDPDIWFKFKDLVQEEFGIHFYELKDGSFQEITSDPFIGNSALPIGNIYIGGAKPEASGMMQMAEFYQKLGEMNVQGDPAAHYVADALGNDKYKADIDIWGAQVRSYFDPLDNGSAIFAKTGSQQGFNPVTGEPMAIRNIVAMVNTGSDGKVKTTLVLTGGIKPDGKATELGWGSGYLKTAREVLEGTGPQVSPQVAQEGLNQLFVDPRSDLNYQLGAISTAHIYPIIKELSQNSNGSVELAEAVRTGTTKYLFVDLVGAPHDNVQTISIHFNDASGGSKLITLNVAANMIVPAGDNVDHFSDNSSQDAIYELLEKTTRTEPEKYGGLLNQLKSQGVNFISLHDYESSPALYTLHEQMKKNGMMFMGAEDAGLVMSKLGLDPNKTVFVNDEMFKVFNGNGEGHPGVNPKFVAEQIFAQREYLAMAEIYKISDSGSTLDSLLYDKWATSNETYQLLKVFIETKTTQTFKPLGAERSFLVNQFEELISNPDREKIAPDIVKAYNLYNSLTSQIARGEKPDKYLSSQFIEAMRRFPTTTKPVVLISLEVGKNPTEINSTQIPSPPQPPFDIKLDMLKATGTSEMTGLELVRNLIKGSEKITGLPENQKAMALTLSKNAQMIIDIYNSGVATNKQGEELKNYIIQNLQERGINVDHGMETFISQTVYDKECVSGYMFINKLLVSQGVPGFIDMDNVDLIKKTAKSAIMPLLDQSKYIDGHWVGHYDDVKHGLSFDFIEQINQLKAGDTLVISTGWEKDEVGHIAQVLWTGYDDKGAPYAVIFDTNGLSTHETKIRVIRNLTSDFIKPEVIQDAIEFNVPVNPAFVVIRSTNP